MASPPSQARSSQGSRRQGIDSDTSFCRPQHKAQQPLSSLSPCSSMVLVESLLMNNFRKDLVQVLRRQDADFVRQSSRFQGVGVTLRKCADGTTSSWAIRLIGQGIWTEQGEIRSSRNGISRSPSQAKLTKLWECPVQLN